MRIDDVDNIRHERSGLVGKVAQAIHADGLTHPTQRRSEWDRSRKANTMRDDEGILSLRR